MSNNADLKGACQYVRQDGGFTYARIPLAMISDIELSKLDIAVAGMIIPWLGNGDSCWVAVDTLARAVNRSRSSVQRSLRSLIAAGWFGVEHDNENATGRRFTALWMQPDGFAAIARRLGLEGVSKVTPAPETRPNVRGSNEFSITQDVCQSAPPSSTAQADRAAVAHAPRSIDDPPFAYGDSGGGAVEVACMGEGAEGQPQPPWSPWDKKIVIGGGAGEPLDDIDPDTAREFAGVAIGVRTILCLPPTGKLLSGAVNAVADRIVDSFFDGHSKRNWCKTLWAVHRGEIPGERFLWAFRKTLVRSKVGDGLDNPGAYCVTLIRQGDKAEADATMDRMLREEMAEQTAVA